ncbi:hypothetical protein FACS1894120_1640 [Clostridia bacterium]|nr:hypothetical protein FACS1894120_1640 [Clostridia bacterium]
MSDIVLESKKSYRSVGKRLTFLIVIMVVSISCVVIFVGYLKFRSSLEHYYIDAGESLAKVASHFVPVDRIDEYLESAETDAEYDETMDDLASIMEEAKATFLYVIQPREDGYHYVFSVATGDEGEVIKEQLLGTVDPYFEEDNPEYAERMRNHANETLFVISDTEYGWLLTVNSPLLASDGTVKGYVALDFSMDKFMDECAAYVRELAVIVLLITVIFSLAYLYIIHKTVVSPINIMSQAAETFLESSLDKATAEGDSDIMKMDIKTKDELQYLAQSLKLMENKIYEFVSSLRVVTLKSETDPLTKLLNREAFRDNVTAWLQVFATENVGHMGAFMMIDVDYFKSVNDTYGHTAGDIVLKSCADTLRKSVRSSDLVGRQGGDEFVVFLKSIKSVEMAEAKARDIKEAWSKIIPEGSNGSCGITASIGISIVKNCGGDTDGSTTFETLFTQADTAVYRAKEGGRDQFVTWQDDTGVS